MVYARHGEKYRSSYFSIKLFIKSSDVIVRFYLLAKYSDAQKLK